MAATGNHDRVGQYGRPSALWMANTGKASAMATRSVVEDAAAHPERPPSSVARSQGGSPPGLRPARRSSPRRVAAPPRWRSHEGCAPSCTRRASTRHTSGRARRPARSGCAGSAPCGGQAPRDVPIVSGRHLRRTRTPTPERNDEQTDSRGPPHTSPGPSRRRSGPSRRDTVVPFRSPETSKAPTGRRTGNKLAVVNQHRSTTWTANSTSSASEASALDQPMGVDGACRPGR